MAVTLLNLRDRVRQRTDNEHDQGFISDAELNALINLKYKELYGLLEQRGLHRSETTFTITPDGSSAYALPSNFWAMLGVFRQDNTTGLVAIWLGRHDHRLRPTSAWKGPALSYRVVGSSIEFYPNPTSGSYFVVYIPVPGDLVADTDTVDGVLGWEEYVVIAASIAILEKEESDTTDLRADLAKLDARIVDEAKAAEMSENPSVQSVRPTASGRMYLPGDYVGIGAYRGYPGWYYRG